MPGKIVLSHFQATPLLKARIGGAASAQTSVDLGITPSEATLASEDVTFANSVALGWGTLEEIAAETNACFEIENGAARKIQAFSELTSRVYTLFPTRRAPTMLVSGFPMHRIKDTDPWTDTLAKVKAAAPVGRVLDTCTGLGYTAIECAKSASEVVTVELDPVAQEIARRNPWSQPLFGNPKITQLLGDSGELIETFEDESFIRILHDPPMFALAGELYSLAFYQQAYRVLKPNGRMFHYIGDPDSKSGAGVTKGVVRRLKEAGFTRLQPRPEAFGVVAFK
ncbi:MAG: class I SAM-dependent methyltransferase [Anaerolineales bacterium]